MLWPVVACALPWMSVGLFGHEPFKPDEAYTVGLVKSVVDSGDWVEPRLVSEPFMEKPPLFFDTAALFVKALPWLPLHEAARVAVLLFVGLGCSRSGLRRAASTARVAAGSRCCSRWPRSAPSCACIS